MANQMSLGLTTPKFEAPKFGSITWYKGQRVTVLDCQEMAEHMTRVVTDNGIEMIVRTRLLGRWTKEQFNSLAGGVDRWL